jgi:hypothetical protein
LGSVGTSGFSNSGTPMWKAPLTLHQRLGSRFHDCAFISTYEKCILACSIFLEKFNSQQNVRYLGRVEVNTIVISRDSPTSPAELYRPPDCSFEPNSGAEFRALHYTFVTDVRPVTASDTSHRAKDISRSIRRDHRTTSALSLGYV